MLRPIKTFHLVDDWEKIKGRVSAHIDHIFDDHSNCSIEWCYALQAQKENKPYEPDEKKIFYCKRKDAILHQQISSALSKFQTKENVRECLHSFDTQIYEVANNIIARYVHKSKHMGTTTTLDTRIVCVVGYKNMGYRNFYMTILCTLVQPEVINKYLLERGIKRLNTIKRNNTNREKSRKNMRYRNHGK